MRFAFFTCSFSIAFPDAIHIPFLYYPDFRGAECFFYPCISLHLLLPSSCSLAFPVKNFPPSSPLLHRATRHSIPAWPGGWVAWASPHLQLALLLQPFLQVDVRGGARHAAERLEVTANQHVVVGKKYSFSFMSISTSESFREWRVFTADGIDSVIACFSLTSGRKLMLFQPEFQVLVQKCCGSLSVASRVGRSSPALRCCTSWPSRSSSPNLRQAVYRVHHVAHRERSCGHARGL